MTATAISEPCPGERDRPVVMFVDGDNEVRIRKREDTPSSCGLVSIEDSAYLDHLGQLSPVVLEITRNGQYSPRLQAQEMKHWAARCLRFETRLSRCTVRD